MKVTHHRTEKEFRTYLVNAPWEDLEQDCHIGRTITVSLKIKNCNRWVMREYDPPVVLSMPDIMCQFFSWFILRDIIEEPCEKEEFRQNMGRIQKHNISQSHSATQTDHCQCNSC